MLVRDDGFTNIQGWMISRLQLRGVALMIYAMIYQFSQDGESVFRGSRQYMADWCGCSISGVKKALKQLLNDGLIEQVHHSIDNHEVFYRACMGPRSQSNLGVGHNVTEARTQCDLAIVHKVTEARSQSDRHIKDDNIADNKADNIADNIVVCDTKRTRFQKPTLEEVKEYAERNGQAIVDPERFIDWHDANGWRAGRNPMKDWKATFRNWERMEKSRNTSGSGKAESVPFMQNEYSKEHLEQKEVDSMRLLDQLLEDE